jgi:hypothetical protein
MKGPIVEIGPLSVFVNSTVGGRQIAGGGGSAHNLIPLVVAWSERTVASGQWPVNAKRGHRAVGEKRANEANLLVVLIIDML